MTTTASVPAYLLPGVTVVHPSHLDGDSSLATEILPGPPSLASIRQPPKKLDLKRPALPHSYLPSSDPGTTYAGLAGGMAPMEVAGPRRKRARVDRGPVHRGHRASARTLTTGATSATADPPVDSDVASSSQPVLEPDTVPLPMEDNDPSLSRSVSSPNLGESSNKVINGKGRRKGRPNEKGKEKEKDRERHAVRVKEEPITVQIPDIPPSQVPPNEDHCSSCSSLGALVYCDGCPRAFHLWCLDPPMEATDLPDGEDRWYCPKCKLNPTPLPRHPSSILSPLLLQLQTSIPMEFQLPEDIRNFFRDVATGPRGTYVDNSTVKPPRVGRHGFGEERDPYRLKDTKGALVLCFRCGKSALPDGMAASGPPAKRARQSSTLAPYAEQWKTIIPCDFCSLQWHLDCLDPPLSSLPPLGKKWKCPNHANHVAPKRRIPKNNAPPIEITDYNQYNNGNIEVINTETSVPHYDKVLVDEVLINGRRYRVPERVIVLDFWSKLRKKTNENDHEFESASNISSPLTSLSSSDDMSDPPAAIKLPSRLQDDDDTLKVAQFLCSMQTISSSSKGVVSTARNMHDKAIQTEPDNSVRLERKDTEHLSDLMKAALKQAPQSGSKVTLDSARITSTPKAVQSSKTPSSISVKNNKVAVNGKHRTATQRVTASSAAAPSRGNTTPHNGKHAGNPGTSLQTIPRPGTPKTPFLNDVETKPNVQSLKIRIPRLNTLTHTTSQPTASSSTSSPTTKSVVLPSAASHPSRVVPRRSLRRQNSASGSSGTQGASSLSRARAAHSRKGSGDSWDNTS